MAVVSDPVCAFELGIVTELFGLDRPEIDGPWYELSVVSADPPPLRTLGGLRIEAPCDLAAVAAAGTVVLPGWRSPGEPPPRELLDAVLAAHGAGARLMSICSGVFVLAATGLLDGRRATTHWRYVDLLRTTHADVLVEPDVLYVDEGEILTSAGSAAGIDLGLHLIRRDHGVEVARSVARRLVVPPHREGGQAQFIARPVVEPDASTPIAEILGWAVEHLDGDLSVAALARRSGMSERTFARRFADEVGSTPHRWVSARRVEAARELLETTDLPIDRVADAVGLGSAATLRDLIRRDVRTTPTAYRAAFRR